jgi:hypothetical protein
MDGVGVGGIPTSPYGKFFVNPVRIILVIIP